MAPERTLFGFNLQEVFQVARVDFLCTVVEQAMALRSFGSSHPKQSIAEGSSAMWNRSTILDSSHGEQR